MPASMDDSSPGSVDTMPTMFMRNRKPPGCLRIPVAESPDRTRPSVLILKQHF